MRVLIFGLPGSGKTTLAKYLVKQIPCLYLNGDVIRKIFKDSDFSTKGRLNQARRMRRLANMGLEIVTLADFVCPLNATRKIFKPDISIWMNTCKESTYPDTNMIFEKPEDVDFEITSYDLKGNANKILKQIRLHLR